MDDEPQVRPGFLPPKAPEGGPPPRFQAPAPPPVAPPPPPPYQAPPADRPVFVAHARESGPSSPMAITGTAIGSVALILLVLTLGLVYPLSGLLAVIGFLLGIAARNQIRARGEGRAGQARAAMWVGGIGIVLSLIAAIVWISLNASGIDSGDLQRWLEDLQRELEQERERPREDA